MEIKKDKLELKILRLNLHILTLEKKRLMQDLKFKKESIKLNKLVRKDKVGIEKELKKLADLNEILLKQFNTTEIILKTKLREAEEELANLK